MLLPLTHLKNNYPRIHSAVQDLRRLMTDGDAVGPGCIGRGIQEACGQFRRQAQQHNIQVMHIL